MSEKRKISIRKVARALLTLVLTGVCLTAVWSATKMQSGRVLSGLDIKITNGEYKFINNKEVKELMLDNGRIQPNETRLSDIDVQQMELDIVSNTWIEDAQVYVDNKHRLHAIVTQRVPVVRIFDRDDNSYYLDKKGDVLELSPKYNCYTTVVTNVPSFGRDSAAEKLFKGQIIGLVNFIRADSFWCRQVSQVIVRDDMKFELVPILGNQQIIIGDTTDLRVKFDNLFAFYTKVLNRIGWEKYEVLDASFKGQIVASPAIDWRLPVDNVINRINWVNSILGDGERIAKAAVPTIKAPQTVTSEEPKVSAGAEQSANSQYVAEQKADASVESAPGESIGVPAKNEKKPETIKPAERRNEQRNVRTKEQTDKKKKETENKPKYLYGGN